MQLEQEYGPPVFIITGLSGSGKSTAMRFLEDLGYYCLDNLPPALIPDFYDLYQHAGSQPGPGVVIVSDVRAGILFDDFADTIKVLEDAKVNLQIAYFDCSTDRLIERFSELKRAHPLEGTEQSMRQAIEKERKRLEPMRALASFVIDTSHLSSHALREVLIRTLSSGGKKDLNQLKFIKFLSFGFKYGVPSDVDFVFDVRFLQNPFYVPKMKSMTGEDDEVFFFVMGEELAAEYLKRVTAIIELTIRPFIKVGKTFITVGVGCTGGRHRSVAFARALGDHFQSLGHQVATQHRDILRPQN